MCSLEDSFTADCPSLMKHPWLAYLPVGVIIFTPLCPHHHSGRQYLHSTQPALAHRHHSAVRLHSCQIQTGPQAIRGKLGKAKSYTLFKNKFAFWFNWSHDHIPWCVLVCIFKRVRIDQSSFVQPSLSLALGNASAVLSLSALARAETQLRLWNELL